MGYIVDGTIGVVIGVAVVMVVEEEGEGKEGRTRARRRNFGWERSGCQDEGRKESTSMK